MNIYLIVTIIITTYLLFFKRNDRKSKINSKIPGPNKLPLIGNLLSFKGIKNPHLLFQDWYKKYGTVFYIRNGSLDVVVLTEYPTLKKAFIDNSDAFADRYPKKSRFKVSKNLDLNMVNGDQHTLLKSLALSSLTPIKIKQFENKFISNQIIQLINTLDKHAKSGKPFEINNYIKMFSLNIIICFTFGENFPYNDVQEVIKIVDAIGVFATASGYPLLIDYFNIPSFLIEKYWKTATPKLYTDCYQILYNHVNSLIEKFKKNQQVNVAGENETILSKMINGYENGNIKEWDAVVGTCIDLFMAGSDTTANSILFALVEIINNNDIQNKVYHSISNAIDQDDINNDQIILTHSKYRNSIPYLSMIIKETYRVHPTVVIGPPHLCKEDTVIDGHKIAAGTQIIQNIYATHKCEKNYKSPDQFIPERFIDASQSSALSLFGIGVRDCIGKSLAECEFFSVLASLINRYEFINPNTSIPLNDAGIFGAAFRCPDTSIIIKKRQ